MGVMVAPLYGTHPHGCNAGQPKGVQLELRPAQNEGIYALYWKSNQLSKGEVREPRAEPTTSIFLDYVCIYG